MSAALVLGPLHGGGLVLGYRCSSRCRHCLYACGPHRRDGEGDGPDALERVLDALARRSRGARFHIGGGEPFLELDRLERAIAGLVGRGLQLDYVETNASWVRSGEHAEQVLARLRDAGLGCLLVSVSPFHAEFVPRERTLALIAAARRTLAGGAFVWIPEFLGELGSQPAGERLDLEAVLRERGAGHARALAARYGLVPAGRAGRFLALAGELHEPEALLSRAPCRARLVDTGHFHVDLDARYVPGLCAGISLPLEEVPGAVPLARYPALAALVRGGLRALLELARERGFTPSRYSAPCDLCTCLRAHLAQAEPGGFPELGPPGFYDPRSLAVEPARR